MAVKLLQLAVVAIQVVDLVLKHHACLDRLLNYAADAAEAHVLVTQHFHLVDPVNHLRRLVILLVYNFDCGVIGAIRVLFEFDTVVNKKVHKPFFFLWG